MNTVLLHSPALIVGLPIFAAILLMVVSRFGEKVRAVVFFAGIALASLAAISLAEQVLSLGAVRYVFGAPSPAAPLVPPDSGGIPVRILFHVDAAGALMLLVAALTSVAAALYALRSEERASGREYFYPLFLLLVGGVYGMVATGDLFNFFVFLEITSLAGAALTAYRIDHGLAAEAGLKYAVVSTLGGLSFLLGVGILLARHNLLNMAALGARIDLAGFGVPEAVAMALMIVPLAMKCGAVPMHQWTPDTYSRAPAPVSAFLLVSSQASLYGLFRIGFSLFGLSMDVSTVGLFVVILAVLSMFIGVTMAIPQHDVKRLISHHAVSQTGYMLLGAGVCLAVLGDPEKVRVFGRDALAGSLFHMMNYAVYNGLLFLAAGAVIYRTGTRNLDRMGGLGRTMPLTMACFGVGALAIAGIPPMSGFASKWVLYESVFRYSPLLSMVAMVVSLLTLASFVKVFQAMFLGPQRAAYAAVRDVPAAMWGAMAVLAVLTVLLGLFPDVVMQRLLLPAADALINQTAYTMPLGGAQ
ncbi:MAG: NADH:ubiquinone oxidoreductase [Verrucomicrobiota bacterium]|jgi:multicomponent Na+:H+ antiporter subunit D|nr:NADH:ubiquinone oxidoreductase [Verrucomicrobiota bacterium]